MYRHGPRIEPPRRKERQESLLFCLNPFIETLGRLPESEIRDLRFSDSKRQPGFRFAFLAHLAVQLHRILNSVSNRWIPARATLGRNDEMLVDLRTEFLAQLLSPTGKFQNPVIVAVGNVECSRRVDEHTVGAVELGLERVIGDNVSAGFSCSCND